jgi:hypothetical protein
MRIESAFPDQLVKNYLKHHLKTIRVNRNWLNNICLKTGTETPNGLMFLLRKFMGKT